MTTLEIVRHRRSEILAVARKHGATNVRVFGSVARGDDSPDSDLDLLVDASESASAWFPARLILDLQELLGRKVDIVTERGLNPYLRDQVLAEARPV
jgi:predicted nucleotidyltransferase